MLVGIGKAAAFLGVTPKTLRLWEEGGLITPERTLGGQRRYDTQMLKEFRLRLQLNQNKKVR
jgi:DNA-binding transcriptional MerR regulator